MNPLFVFLSPPSPASLKARLMARATEPIESIKSRIDAAVKEMEYAESDKPGEGHDLTIVNEDGSDGLEKAYRALEQIALGESLPSNES